MCNYTYGIISGGWLGRGLAGTKNMTILNVAKSCQIALKNFFAN